MGKEIRAGNGESILISREREGGSPGSRRDV